MCLCVCVKKKRNAYENDEMVQYKQTKWPVITTRKIEENKEKLYLD